jgi:hypothetical protein
MRWKGHILTDGGDGGGFANTDRFNILMANRDLRIQMLYEWRRCYSGTITLPHKKGACAGRKRVTAKRRRAK